MVNTFPLVFGDVAFCETDYGKLTEYDFIGPIYEMDAGERLKQMENIAEYEAVSNSSLRVGSAF